MKKRILSLMLTVVMIVSMMAVFSIPAFAAPMAFTVQPSVLIGGGNEYNIVWHNNNISVGWVTYTYKGTTYTVYDEENGVVRSDDSIHTVRVPMEHLDAAGAYEVHAEAVVSRDGYNITTSGKSSLQRSFKGFKGTDNVRIGFLSDTHLLVNNNKKYDSMLQSVKTAVDSYMGTPDLVVLNGDITNNMQYEDEFYALFDMFEICGHNGTTPVLYVVGNHEKRGKYSIMLEKYLTYNTGEFYSSFDFGPASIIVTDIGEDKADDSLEYGGLTDMDHYFEEQYEWLRLHPGYTNGAKYNFSIGHSPSYVDRYLKSEMSAVFSNLGTDVHIAGHSHKLEYYKGNTNIVVHDGGHDNNEKVRTTLVTLNKGTYTFKGFDANGATLLEQTLSATANGSPAKTVKSQADVDANTYTSPETQPVTNDSSTAYVPTRAGVSTMTLKGAANTTALTTKPVVFEAGDYYNVVWQTTWGIPCAGYVEIVGEAKQWKDSHGGKLRTETTHSVRIPKEKLAGKTYTIKSRVVMNYNAYGNYYANDPTKYGPDVVSAAIKFQSLPAANNAKYTIIAVANKTGGREDAQKLKKAYNGGANLLVLLGDMTTDFNKETNFGKSILDYANEITGGEYPVMFLRGENETKGEFAANLARHIRVFTSDNVTNRFYQSYVHGGDYSFIGLDTATTKSDTDMSYKGYASFDKYRKEQIAWLNNMPKVFPGQYNIVFANAPDLKNVAGDDFTKNFTNLKIQLAVTAGKGKAELKNSGAGYSVVKVGSSNGVVITLANDKIKVEAVNDSKSDLGEIKVEKKAAEQKPVTPKPNNSGTAQKPSTDSKPSDIQTPTEENKPSADNEQSGQKQEQTEKDDTVDNETADESTDEGDIDYVKGYAKEGWYKDFLGFNITVQKDAAFSLTANVTEGQFIHALARVCGFNPNHYADNTAEEKAVSWAKIIRIVKGKVNIADPITEDGAKQVLASMFEQK